MRKLISLLLVVAMFFGLAANLQAVKAETPSFSEAPKLAAKVASGELPKVEDRLPVAEDVFVETNSSSGEALEIGSYAAKITFPTTGVGN